VTMIDRDDPTADVTARESTTPKDAAMAGLNVWMLVAVHLDRWMHFRDLPNSFSRGGP
jgi:hypothetical protein